MIYAPDDAIVVADAQLSFHADYKRSGTDLILSGDAHEYVLHDHFKGAHRAPLASPDGARLTAADIVKALVGEVDVAQAANNPAASQMIGHVTKLQGSAGVIRNGVSVILNMGDNVEKGDVVESGAGSGHFARGHDRQRRHLRHRSRRPADGQWRPRPVRIRALQPVEHGRGRAHNFRLQHQPRHHRPQAVLQNQLGVGCDLDRGDARQRYLAEAGRSRDPAAEEPGRQLAARERFHRQPACWCRVVPLLLRASIKRCDMPGNPVGWLARWRRY